MLEKKMRPISGMAPAGTSAWALSSAASGSAGFRKVSRVFVSPLRSSPDSASAQRAQQAQADDQDYDSLHGIYPPVWLLAPQARWVSFDYGAGWFVGR